MGVANMGNWPHAVPNRRHKPQLEPRSQEPLGQESRPPNSSLSPKLNRHGAASSFGSSTQESRGTTPWPTPAHEVDGEAPDVWIRPERWKLQAYRERPQVAQQLANLYGNWVTTLEAAVLEHSEVPQQQWDGFSGRAKGYSIKWKKSAAAPGRPHLHDPEAEWWAILHTQVTAINGLVKNKKDPEQLAARTDDFQKRVQ